MKMRAISAVLLCAGTMTTGIYAQSAPDGIDVVATASSKKGSAAAKAVRSPPVACVVGEFRAIGLTVHNPSERHQAALAWLKTYGNACSAADLAFLDSNKAQWMGSADSVYLMDAIDGLQASKVKSESRKVPATPAATAVTDVSSAKTP
ncbi:MAG: hypothetical protein WCK81_06875 [Betaproteobacteria bacterium]